MLYECACAMCGRSMEHDHEDGAPPLCSEACEADFDLGWEVAPDDEGDDAEAAIAKAEGGAA